MNEGIVQGNKRDEEIAEFLINDGYPADVFPVSCILTGSRAFGINLETSDRDYVGIHLMDTWECLEHPNFRKTPLVIRKQFNSEMEEMKPGTKGGDISLDSFEFWKFIDLLLKGSFVTYEILYMPVIHHDPSSNSLIELCRAGLTNRIGKAAKGNALHDWGKDKRNRKKAVLSYLRLLQALFYLKEEEFEWKAEPLWDYARPAGLVDHATDVLHRYMDPELRRAPLTDEELNFVPGEIGRLIDEVDLAMVTTKLPDQCPRRILDEILQRVKRTRSIMI